MGKGSGSPAVTTGHHKASWEIAGETGMVKSAEQPLLLSQGSLHVAGEVLLITHTHIHHKEILGAFHDPNWPNLLSPAAIGKTN